MPMSVVVYACQQAVPGPEALARLQGDGLALRVLPEPCSSKVEAFQLMRTLATPVDLVWVIGCAEERCQYQEGSHRLASRVAYVQRYLKEIGLEPERLGKSLIQPGDQGELAAVAAEVKARAKSLGPSPLKEKG